MEWMERAFEEARRALAEGEVPVGCVFVREGREICAGRNATNRACDASRHAELVALDALRGEAAGARGACVYVTVEPCIMCAQALALANVAKVVFGCANDKFGGCGSILAIHERGAFPQAPNHVGFAIESGVRKDEAIDLLRQFYNRENEHTTNKKPKLRS